MENLKMIDDENDVKVLNIQSTREKFIYNMTGDEFYNIIEKNGGKYGPSFRSIEKIWFSVSDSLSKIKLSLRDDNKHIDKINSLVLDNIFLSLTSTFMTPAQKTSKHFIGPPAGIGNIQYFGKPTKTLWVLAKRIKENNEKFITGNIYVYNDEGELVVIAKMVKFHRLEKKVLNHVQDNYKDYSLIWKEGIKFKNISKIDMKKSSLIFSNDVSLNSVINEYFDNNENVQVINWTDECNNKLNKNYNHTDKIILYKQYFADKIKLINKRTNIIFIAGYNQQKSILAEFNTSYESMLGVSGLCQAICLNDNIINTSDINLSVVTRGSLILPNENTKRLPSDSILWGMVKTLLLEINEFNIKIFDIDIKYNKTKYLNHLFQLVKQYDSIESQIVLRSNTCWYPRVIENKILKENNIYNFDSNSAYLILGGTGSLGRELASVLAANGAKHIILASRSAEIIYLNQDEIDNSGLMNFVHDFRRLGVNIYLKSVDAISEISLKNLFIDFDNTYNIPITGIFHLAAVLKDSSLVNIEENKIKEVVFTKCLTAINLYNVIKELKIKIDIFVMFSSFASIIGSPGQSHYAGANAFLNEFIHYLKSNNIPAISFNWGPWEMGMSQQDIVNNNLNRRGLKLIDRYQANNYLIKNLDSNTNPQKIFFKFSENFLDNYISFRNKSNILDDIGFNEVEDLSFENTNFNNDFIHILSNVPYREREALIKHKLACIVQEIGQFDTSHFDESKDLLSLGLDSLMLLEMKGKLETMFALRLPINEILSGLTLSDLVNKIQDAVKIYLEITKNEKKSTLKRKKEEIIF